MTTKRRVIAAGHVLLFLLLSIPACKMLGLAPSSQADVKAFARTLQGLNEDMRDTLQKIRDRQNVEANTELLHDQLHLMRDILHLVDKTKREEPAFQKLHDLNHEMRDRWHDVKKGREREANLGKLHDQLDQMTQVLQGLT